METNPSPDTEAAAAVNAGDLGPLAWVLDETRKSIDTATKSLKRFARAAQEARGVDLASIDSSQLRVVRQQLHQVVGALDMVGQPVASHMVSAMETAVQRFVLHPEQCTEEVAAVLERAGFALVEFLENQLGERPRSALGLFPQYSQMLAMAGTERIHPADLWTHPWRWVDVPSSGPAQPLDYSAAVRSRWDQRVLKIMRHADANAAAELATICLGLADAQSARRAASFWRLAAGFFEAMGQKRLKMDVYTKRAASRVLMQYASLAQGDTAISERLAQDLLYFCAVAGRADAGTSPALAAVQRAWGVVDEASLAYDDPSFGLYDPGLLVQARRRIESVKENWSALAGGDIARLKASVDQFALVADSLEKLHERGRPLADALRRVAAHVGQSGRAPSPELAMEAATAVLFLEASFTDFHPADEQFNARTLQLADRLDVVREAGTAPALEPWMEELYRRVSDRQTMGTVVSELRGTLGEVEQRLDQFFRDPADKTQLAEVPGLLSQMRGVLSVLGLEQPAQAVHRMRESVDGLLDTEVQPEQAKASGTFDRLGNSLGALGFMIDMLGYQPVLARQLFVLDEASGELRHVGGRVDRQTALPVESPGDLNEPDLLLDLEEGDALQAQASEPQAIDAALVEAPSAQAPQSPASMVMQPWTGEPMLAPDLQAPVVDSSANAGASAPAAAHTIASDAPDESDDLLDIFLEEAREVIQSASEAIRHLAHAPSDLERQTTLRRAFHTLKGSSRMVGLTEFGEAAWSMEQLLNAWLAEQKPVSEDLRSLSQDALDAFGRWVGDIARRDDAQWQAAPFRQSADAMRMQGRFVPLEGDAGTRDEFVLAPDETIQTSAALAAPALEIEALELDGEFVADAPLEVPATIEEVQPHKAVALPELPILDLPDADALDDAQTDAVGEPPASELHDEPFELALSDEHPLQSAPVAPELADDLADLSGVIEVSLVDGGDVALTATGDEQAEVLRMGDDDTQAAGPALDRSLPVLQGDAGAAAPALFEPSVESARAQAPDESLALDLSELSFTVQPEAELDAEAEPAPMPPEAFETAPHAWLDDEESHKQIGDLRISTPLYNVYLNEADEWSRELAADLDDWAADVTEPVPERAVARAHSLAGSSATVGLRALSELARAIEHALQRLVGQPQGTQAQAQVLTDAAQDIRRVLHQFAVGMLKSPQDALLSAVQAVEPTTVQNSEPVASETEVADPAAEAGFVPLVALSAPMAQFDGDSAMAPLAADAEDVGSTRTITDAPEHAVADDIDVVDMVDPDLFPIFEEEAEELLPALSGAMRQWLGAPTQHEARAQVLRHLHTLKGSARLAGALRLGEMAHRAESSIEAIGMESVGTDDLEPVLDHVDELQAAFRRLQGLAVAEAAPAASPRPARVAEADAAEPPPSAQEPAPALADGSQPQSAEAPPSDQPAPVRFGEVALPAPLSLVTARAAASQAVRVRSQLLDRLVTQAGEVMTSRARLEVEVGQLRGSLGELTSNLERLRQQLRDVELQAETQMQSRLALTRDAQQNFDPLEFDRFTRMQELTRMMAESVNDVATVQRSLQRAIDASESGLAAQARQSRELQRDLLRTRMIEFEGIAERLYRVVRQASKEMGKQVRLDITGGSIEMDRGILDRMTPAFEHLLRNCVVHGIEPQAERVARHKDAAGLISIGVHQVGNDVSVEFRDDGAGLDLQRIRTRALEQGLLTPDQSYTDAEISNLIFAPGFTTAAEVTELAGRGVGMDVVRTEVQALGGRIETNSREGEGTSFRLVLPLTTAVTQVVMIRSGQLSVGVPSNLVEIVQRATPKDLQQAYNSGTYPSGDEALPFFWSGALLQSSARSVEPQGRTTPVIIFRSADQRVAMHVDEVLGNQEVVVKALGPQLSRLPGLVAITALASGAVALIYNPVALASVYGEQARALSADQAQPDVMGQGAVQQLEPAAPTQTPTAVAPRSDIPLVLVVDDSITVRRVTQRLLQREGYRVALAADGLQGLERLQAERPAVVLSDIEMPRMDGFDFVRNIRADERLRDLPVVMITSRIAEKHREHARELGVNEYLGKPYSEDDLLALVKRYAQAGVAAR